MKVTTFLAAGVVLGLGLTSFYFAYIPRNVENVLVKEKDRVCSTTTECRYLIFTDKGVYENTDTLIFLKTNSSDYYANIDANVRYNFKTVGVRFSLFSWYPNIINYKKVD